MIGQLVIGDLQENTMTFEIEGDCIMKAGRYKIMLIDDELELEVCQEFGVSSPDLLRLKTRKREIVLARQVIMYYDMVYKNKYHRVASDRFGLDRNTARHAKNTINNLLETDKGFKRQFESIIERLSGN